MIPVDPHGVYLLSGWIRTNDTGDHVAGFGLRFLDAHKRVLATVAPHVAAIPTWQFIQLRFGAGAGNSIPDQAAYAEVVIFATYRVEFSELSLCAR